MAKNYHPKTLIRFICRDFEHAWEALSRVPEGELGARGNFMFARQAMTLLEVACRLCNAAALSALSAQLKSRDPRYFTPLPGPCRKPGSDPLLPSDGPNPDSQLIAALFDLIRHGQAHQYQQIIVNLTDSRDFACSLTGARFQLSLNKTFANGRPSDHLRAKKDSGDIWIKVRTDVLYLDIRDSIRSAKLLSQGLSLTSLQRGAGSRNPKFYQFSASDLKNCLEMHGHFG